MLFLKSLFASKSLTTIDFVFISACIFLFVQRPDLIIAAILGKADLQKFLRITIDA